MARYNNKKLQTQRNFQSIWHSKPEYLSTLLKEDQYIREYIIGTMKAKGWKLSEIIIKRKVKQIHIAFQIQNKKVKERKRWTKNRLKNQNGTLGFKGSSIRRKTNTQGIHSSLSVRTRLRKINIKKRYLFFQLYLMITELRKMHPNNQITFYVQKTKPLQFNANLINSWIVENIKKKKSYRRLLNKVISKFKKAQNGLKPIIDNNNMVNTKMSKGSNIKPISLSLKKKDKKNFFSWVTGNLIYLYNVHTQLNHTQKLIGASSINDRNKKETSSRQDHSLENVHGLAPNQSKRAPNQSKRAPYSKALKVRLSSGRSSKRFRSLWLIWRRKYDSASKFSRSKRRSRRLSKSSYLRKRLNKRRINRKVIRPAMLAKLGHGRGPINKIINRVALRAVAKPSLQPTWQLVGVTKKSKASANKLALRARLRKIKTLKSIRTVPANSKTIKSNRIEDKFKLDITTKSNWIERIPKGSHLIDDQIYKGSELNGLSTVELTQALGIDNEVKSTGLSLKKSKSLMDSALISTLGPRGSRRDQIEPARFVNRRFSTIEINQDIRSTWKLMRKLSRGKNLKKRKIDRVKRHLSGILKHRKEFNQDTLLLLNYYKLKYLLSLTSSSQSIGINGSRRDQIGQAQFVMSEEGKNFLWQGKNFIRFLQLHPTLLDHTINCLTSHSHFNSQIEFLTRVWVGFFDYIYHYESRLCLGKWQGIRILLSGRVGYKKMGRAKKYSSFWGSLKNSSARLPLQYSYSQLHTRYGAVGVRVFVR